MAQRAFDKLPQKPNLRPAEIAEFLDCALATVYNLIHAGKIPAKKLTRHYRIPRAEFLEAWGKADFQAEF